MKIMHQKFRLIAYIMAITFAVTCKDDEPKKSSPYIWSYQFPVEIYYCSPALSSDESTVYIGTSTWFYGDHKLGHQFAALDAASGAINWTIPLSRNEVRSTPAIAPDESIYFVVQVRDELGGLVLRDELWKVSPSGSVSWKYNINPNALGMDIGLSTPAIGVDGTVYVAGDRLYAINSDGTLRWTAFSSTYETMMNSPIIGNDGTIYFVYHNIPLTALSPSDGTIKWSCALGVNDHCFASPAIGSNGDIIVAQHPSTLYAVTSNGQIRWTFNLSSVGFTGYFRSSPSIDKDGTIYLGINMGSPTSAFFAINNDGTLKWIFEPTDLPSDVPKDHFDIYSSPAIGEDSIVYFGQEFGRIYALKTKDGSVVSMVETKQGITWSSPAISKNGILYISDLSGTIYATKNTSKGLCPLAYWPKYRYDNQNRANKASPEK